MISRLSRGALESIGGAFFHISARRAAIFFAFSRSKVLRFLERATFHKLAAEFDACITLTAPGAAPVGLDWTGDPIFVVPASMLGVPAITLPALQDGGLPLGLQLLGFADRGAALFSIAGGVLAVL
jgi:Asp-tRNA(Asn)/Glu-tRNA(Gln) amidotransferase A subunit family amidase